MKTYLEAGCPICGKRIFVNSRGYLCEECGFIFPRFICNRHISAEEADRVLRGHREAFDGFSSNDGKIFSALLVVVDGTVKADNTVCHCTHHDEGGKIIVRRDRFLCLVKNICQQKKCKFPFRRWYNGHKVSIREIELLVEKGRVEFEVVDENGKIVIMTLVNDFSTGSKVKIAE